MNIRATSKGKRGFLMVENLVALAVLAIAVLSTIYLILSVTRSYMILDPVSKMKYNKFLNLAQRELLLNDNLNSAVTQAFKFPFDYSSVDINKRELLEILRRLKLDESQVSVSEISDWLKLMKIMNTLKEEKAFYWTLDSENPNLREIFIPGKGRVKALAFNLANLPEDLKGQLPEDQYKRLISKFIRLPGIDTNGDGVPDPDRSVDYWLVILPSKEVPRDQLPEDLRNYILPGADKLYKATFIGSMGGDDYCRYVSILITDYYLVMTEAGKSISESSKVVSYKKGALKFYFQDNHQCQLQ